MIELPAVAALVQRTKALAALDLILSPEWESRYYSFNSAWAASERMASMRNGSGDEWWLVFHASGWAALKGLAHESQAWSDGGGDLSVAIQNAFPAELTAFTHEPAFCWDSTSFGYFYLPSASCWRRANDATSFSDLDAGDDYLLRHLTGGPSDYVSFVEEYYEKTIPLSVVTDVFREAPITQVVISALNPEITIDDIAKELYSEIGYSR